MSLEDANRKRISLTPRQVRLALLAIILIGAALRLHGLGARSFWIDEGIIVRLAQFEGWGASLFDPDYTNDPPLFPFIIHFWARLVDALPGTDPGTAGRDVAFRLFPCLVGILTIPLVFLTGRTLLKDDAAALLGALVFAISPFQVNYAQELRNYTCHVALGTAAFLFVVKALEENRVRHWVAWTLCAAAGIYNNSFMVWVIVALNGYFVTVLPWHAGRLRAWIASNLAVILLAIPALKLAMFYAAVFESAHEHWYPYPSPRLVLLTFKAFFMGYSPSRLAYTAMVVVAGTLTLLGLVRLRHSPRAMLALCALALVPTLGNAIYFQFSNFPYYTHRLMICSAVPCYILVGYGMRVVKHRAFSAVAAILFIALTLPALADHYANRIHPVWDHRVAVLHKIENRDAARFVADRCDERDIIGHRVRYTVFSFDYYLAGHNVDRRVLCFTRLGSESATWGYPHLPIYENYGVLPVRVEDCIATASRLWYVKTFWEPYAYDPESELLRRWFDAHAFRQLSQPFDGLTLFLYDNAPDARAAARTWQLADFGEWDMPYYEFPETPAGQVAARRWQPVFLERFTPPTSQTPATFALYFEVASVDAGQPATHPADSTVLVVDDDAGQQIVTSFPRYADDTFAYRFTVANGPEAERNLEGRIIESAEVIEPLGFNRADAESDAWQPVFQYDGGPPKGAFNVPAMNARVNADTPPGRVIYQDILLDPGDYDVWAWIIQLTDTVAVPRIEARFAIAPLDATPAKQGQSLLGDSRGQSPFCPGTFEEVGATDGANPSCTPGWGWRRIGAWRCDGGAARFRVTTANPHRLSEGYFDLGRVMFVRRSTASFETERFQLTLAPFEQKTYAFSSSLKNHATKRVDVELFDPLSRQFRRIHFYVCQLPVVSRQLSVPRKPVPILDPIP